MTDAVRSIGVTEVDHHRELEETDNGVRPHASLGYRPPAQEVFVPAFAACPAAHPDRLRRPGSY
jgi:hypothetical protein